MNNLQIRILFKVMRDGAPADLVFNVMYDDARNVYYTNYKDECLTAVEVKQLADMLASWVYGDEVEVSEPLISIGTGDQDATND